MKEHQMHHHPHDSHHGHNFMTVLAWFGLLACFFETGKLVWLHRRFGESSDLRSVLNDDDDHDSFAPVVAQATPLIYDEHKGNQTGTLRDAGLPNSSINEGPFQPTCTEEMRQVFQRHWCMLQEARGEKCGDVSVPPGPRHFKEMTTQPPLGAPVHHLSYMWGQGFGRIVQQSVRTCLLAALLNRPCSIDMIRDKYHNLRSFLQPGPYNWDQASRIVLDQHGVNITHALHLMPQGVEKGHGWESLVSGETNSTSRNSQVHAYSDVLPMVWGHQKPNQKVIQEHLDEWDQSNPDHGKKVLLSPNFADAWYAYGKDYLGLGRQWNKRHRACTGNHMKTYLQNEMFVPTSLAYELHRERRAIVLREKAAQDKRHQKQEQLTTRSSATGLPPYGAIHLRMKILNQDMYKMGVSKEQVLSGLKQCLDRLANDEALHVDMRWWLISDDVALGHYISQQLHEVYSFSSESNLLDLHKNQKAVKGIHSGDAINRRFGQEAMAPSITDWMALHESQIALITYDSAYGETGARGNGKIAMGNCGGQIKNSRNSFPMFLIHRKDS